MTIFVDLVAIYSLYAFACLVLIARFGKVDRLASGAVAALFPILCFAALILTLTRPMSVRPCPVGLEDVEVAIEKQRKIMFGGPDRTTAIAKTWQTAYTLHLEAQSQRVRSLTHHLQGLKAV